MTAAALTHLPVAAGGAVLSATGNLIHWGFSRYMRAPLANTGILAMLTLSAMASSNALYWQRHEHPAPLFGAPDVRQASIAPVESEPVIPAERPRRTSLTIAPLPSEETTGSVDATAPVEAAIGNAEVAEIQRKLHSMQLYDGAIDGLYGPRTARAIRAFEQRAGLPPKGELTRDLLEAVRKSSIILPEASVEPLPTPDPLPTVNANPATDGLAAVEAQPVPTATAMVTEQPLPAPAPIKTQTADAEPVAKRQTPRRELPATPQQAFDVAVDTAGDAIDTIIKGVQTMAMTTPGTNQPAAEVRQVAPAAAEPKIELASVVDPKPGVTLALPEEQATVETEVAVLEGDTKPEELMPPFSVTDPVIVARVQRGLASLGFLHAPADGIAGEATAKAIRNFEVYYNYKVTGRISPELLDLLVQNGASI